MHHLCWAIKEGIRSKRKQTPCGRLLSEIFTQGQLVKTLKNLGNVSDKTLRTITGKIINGKTLQNMKIIKKFSPNEKDLKESTDQTKLMKDFPPIFKERNPEVLNELISGFIKETAGIIVDDDTPDIPDEVALQVRRKRTITGAGSEATSAQTKKSKKDMSEASKSVNSSAPVPKRKRGKGESSKAASEAEEERAKKKTASEEQYERPMFEMTLEMTRMAQEQADEMVAAKKKEKAELKAARDAKLQSIGIDGCNEFYMEKLAEVKQIADNVEQLAVKEAKEMLEKIPEASEADALEASPKVTQTSDLPFIIPTHISPSKESDHDDIPLGQRMKRLHKPSPQPQQTTNQTPLQEEQTSAVAECSEDPEEPKTSDLPRCDSPSNLFSLERHLGGEITKTPQKATTSASEKTDVAHQQQPKPIQQSTPEPSTTQTQTSTPTQISTKQQIIPEMTIPEPAAETVVPESVPVTESEPSMSIADSEPTQTLSTTLSTNDQPSSSSSQQIQTHTQPRPNLLKSEYLEAEMLHISNEFQRLVKLRRSPTLKDAYEDQWATLKTRASELLNSVSQRCLNIKAAAYMHRFSSVLSVEEDQAPLLYLANAPFFPESDYLTREAKMFKLLKQNIMKQQEDAKAREDLLLQKQLELEEALKKQAALIEQLMNKQPNP